MVEVNALARKSSSDSVGSSDFSGVVGIFEILMSQPASFQAAIWAPELGAGKFKNSFSFFLISEAEQHASSRRKYELGHTLSRAIRAPPSQPMSRRLRPGWEIAGLQ
jgi:hypothetical protein